MMHFHASGFISKIYLKTSVVQSYPPRMGALGVVLGEKLRMGGIIVEIKGKTAVISKPYKRKS